MRLCLANETARTWTNPQLLFLVQQIVILITLIQSDHHVLQPVPHTQGELKQLILQAWSDVWIR